MTLQARKENIISKIKYVNEHWLLKSIEKLLSDVDAKTGLEEKEANYGFYVGNIAEEVDLEKIKSERPLKKLDMVSFAKAADALEWEQSIDQLLEDLS